MIWIDNSDEGFYYVINEEDDECSDNDHSNNFLIIQIYWDHKQRWRQHWQLFFMTSSNLQIIV
jgi:hypothetical protein